MKEVYRPQTHALLQPKADDKKMRLKREQRNTVHDTALILSNLWIFQVGD